MLLSRSAPRCGEDETPDAGVLLSAKALPDSAVLAVYRSYLAVAVSSSFGDELAGHDEHFFVRQGDDLARLQRRQRRDETRLAHSGDDDEVDVWMSSHRLHGKAIDAL